MERWIASVGYCLPVTQFSAKQCADIQKPWYNAILPKMGFNRHIKRAVIFGPIKFQGKQLTDYGTYQYTSRLERFVAYIRQDTEMGNLMRIQMDQHQRLIGSEKHFLERDSSQYPYGDSSRIQFYGSKIRNTEYG